MPDETPQPDHRTCLPEAVAASVDAALAPVDAELAARYPGDPGTRQPVHTVYVPADALTAGTPAEWGRAALDLLDRHAHNPETLASALGLGGAARAPHDEAAFAQVHARVRAKLAAEPVEDLRIDFEDGYGSRSDAEEDEAAVRAAATVAGWAEADPGACVPPYVGIRLKCMEAPVRRRGLRTLDLFLTGLLDAGGLPDGLLLTLPKVSRPEQVAQFAAVCRGFEDAAGLPAGRLGFEIQIETTAAVLGADGRATVAELIGAAEGRATALHYGTFDYSADCGISAAHQAPDHPAADHAKAVMQAAAAGTGVRLSDGSTNVLPVGGTGQVHRAWRLHHRLVRRAAARGYYQGWDMHPGHLPSRYAAVFGFFRHGAAESCARIARYRSGAQGAVLDEPATVRALAGYLLRGLDCGALTEREVAEGAGTDRRGLEQLAGR
ncbi:DUF6986 family protein [Streptomyces xiaopingdaonensis]|uniref:DUF6986 family protein n=1 Tax=Streptomyces xiaopingdaonensis TaxID=1565415 RepID=UPI0003053C36|nr:aldolase/citrate lyase family protein [Streptomyces xiaopingdaonensis]